MSFENQDEVTNQKDIENIESNVISEETSTEEQTKKEEKISPFKKVETWIILAIFVIPAIWFISKQFKKDTPPQTATQQQTDIAAMLATLEQKATVSPSYENLLALGIAYENNGRAFQAVKTLEKALQLSPNNPIIYNNLGYAKILLRDYDDAITALEKAIQLDTTSKLAKNNLVWAKTEKENLRKSVQKKETTPEKNRDAKFYVYLALDYQTLRQYDKAVECNKKAIALDAKNILAHNNLGVIYMFQSKYDDAIAAFQKAIELDGSFQLAKNNLKWAQDEKAASASSKK